MMVCLVCPGLQVQGCQCQLCNEMNAFFRDPQRSSTEIPNASSNSQRRRHLQAQLSSTPRGNSLITLTGHTRSVTLSKPTRAHYQILERLYQQEAKLIQVRLIM